MNGLNLSDASDIKLGGSTINAIYYGSTLLWPLKRDYSKEYLTIEAVDNSIIVSFEKNSTSISKDIQYSKDKSNWTTISFNTSENATQVELNIGEKIYLKGNNSSYGDYPGATKYYCNIKIIGNNSNVNLYGNIMSLLYEDDFINKTTLYRNYTFWYLFRDSTAIIDTSNLILPATTLYEYCYYRMFYGCTSLTSAPELPATTLASYCYSGMFNGCTSLTSAPKLPATTLASYCYSSMFNGCTSLTSAPELPATTLATSCYGYMFANCEQLTVAPELPATTLSNGCYSGMFYGCTSLTSAPELPATTLADVCYWQMFMDCTSLISPPELPATTLSKSCYYLMFSGCISLTSAPELLATTLADSCYFGMLRGCTSLTTAPELPATTLAYKCYREMFYSCDNLTTAPDLPATTLLDGCYREMFRKCKNINYIKCLATDISANDCTYIWTGLVALHGTFVKNPNMTNWTTGADGIPSGWTVQDAS